MSTEHVSIVIRDDFMARQTRAEPVQAIAELIWNSVDADARRVVVDFEHKDLAGGLSRVIVYDNGHGISREEVKALFGSLGGSWKRMSRRTKGEGRMVHGQEGRGRYKAFALGRSAEWRVCYLKGQEPQRYTITLLESDLTNVAISDESEAPGERPGVTVVIDDLKRNLNALTSDATAQELAEIFALYLTDYRQVEVVVGDETIDPQKAILHRHSEMLSPIIDEEGREHQVELEIIEWRRATKRVLYLCNEQGFPLSPVNTRFHTGHFTFSAYLKSAYITRLHNDERLGLQEMDAPLQRATEQGLARIKDHFRNRAAERARTVVDEWKAENVYPFQGEPAGPIERAERQVFDIVAVSVQDYAPDFGQTELKTKKLHLRMLRQAIERSPSDLQLILKEVLDLPPRKQEELAKLLQETTLSAIITAAKTIADRLKFLTGLGSILFEPETKGRLKERSQLHKILAENTWIFGEEYHLWVSDRGLTQVLRKHKEHLDPAILIDEPVKAVGKSRAIVDLMLSRTVHRHRADDFEQLVVELKAPAVKIGPKEITQTLQYAMAVAGDERFKTVPGVRWHFWMISNERTDYAEGVIDGGPDRSRRLIHKSGNISVGIKTWGEMLEENRARLQFFQEHLQYDADESEALRHLQERHKRFLEGVIEEEEPAEGAPPPDEIDRGAGGKPG